MAMTDRPEWSILASHSDPVAKNPGPPGRMGGRVDGNRMLDATVMGSVAATKRSDQQEFLLALARIV